MRIWNVQHLTAKKIKENAKQQSSFSLHIPFNTIRFTFSQMVIKLIYYFDQLFDPKKLAFECASAFISD